MDATWPRRLWAALIAVAFAGAAAPQVCLAEPTAAATVGNVRLDPVLKLLDRAAGIRTVMGPDGRVDLIVSSRETHEKTTQVRFSRVAIQSDVVGEEEPIATINADGVENSDVALDHSGNLHVVIDGKFYTRTPSGWSTPEEGPDCRRLIPAADSLVCMLIVSGADIGTPRRWEWFLGPGFVLPWHVETQKIVLTRRTATGWSGLTVVDPETKFDVGNVALAADDMGAAHLIYSPISYIFGTPSVHRPRYAHVERGILPPSTPEVASDSGVGRHMAASVTGQDMLTTDLTVSLTVDPTSGQVFGTCWGVLVKGAVGFTIDNGVVSKPFPIPSYRGSPFARAYAASAGNGRYHVVVGATTGHFKQISHVSYLSFANGKWSDPIALGEASGRGGQTFGLQLVSDRSGHAFVTWVDNDDSKPRGRFIHLTD